MHIFDVLPFQYPQRFRQLIPQQVGPLSPSSTLLPADNTEPKPAFCHPPIDVFAASTMPPTTPDATTPEFQCEVDPGDESVCLRRRYPYPYDCAFYYSCFATCDARLDQCGEGLEYNAAVQECVDPSLSDCIGEPSSGD